MSKPIFTPGPWAVADFNDGEAVWTEAEKRDCVITYTAGEWRSQRQMPFDERRANARLIAAAPELYEALAGLLDVLNEYVGWRNTAAHEPRETTAENKARAALAKARGETP